MRGGVSIDDLKPAPGQDQSHDGLSKVEIQEARIEVDRYAAILCGALAPASCQDIRIRALDRARRMIATR